MRHYDNLIQSVADEFGHADALTKATTLFASAGRARDYEAIVQGRTALRWLHCFASLGGLGHPRAATDEILGEIAAITGALEQAATPELAAADIRRGMAAAARVADLLSATQEEARQNATLDTVLNWLDEIMILAAALEQIEARRRMAARAIASRSSSAAH